METYQRLLSIVQHKVLELYTDLFTLDKEHVGAIIRVTPGCEDDMFWR